MFGDFFRPTFELYEPVIFFMFPRCDNDNKSTWPLEAEGIPVLHSVAGANASDESEGVAKQEDEQIGIFQILDKLEEAVDALLNTSSSLSLSLLVKSLAGFIFL